MKRDDSVFFFTLVDFLVTALFFGVVLVALARRDTGVTKAETQLANVKKATGISDIVELTDALTRLGPLRQAAAVVRAAARIGDSAHVEKAASLMARAGGMDSLGVAVAKFRGDDGFGKPPCAYTVDASGRKQPIPVAVIEATDTVLTVVRGSAEFEAVLNLIGRDFDSVRRLRLVEFRQAFGDLVSLRPECRYTVNYIERTALVAPLRAVQTGFRTQLASP